MGSTVPQRVVSLVPSITESLFAMGLGVSVVGITDFCIYPEGVLQKLPSVGGPKTINVQELLALEPDLVIANQEENSKRDIEKLYAAGINVLLTFPKTVEGAIADLWEIAGIFQKRQAAVMLRGLECSYELALLASQDAAKRRYFCSIWQEETNTGLAWWMTFNGETYSSDLLAALGGANCFEKRERRYPLMADLGLAAGEESGERDTRYPRMLREEVLAADPEVILLPTEPFPYDETAKAQIEDVFRDTEAVKNGRVYVIDGSLITWPGTRLGLALQELSGVFD